MSIKTGIIAVIVIFAVAIGAFAAAPLFRDQREANEMTAMMESSPEGATMTTLGMGEFTSRAHPTSGSAKIVEHADGRRQLILENFSTDPGPDLRVWIAPPDSENNPIDLGALRAEKGSLVYDIPADAELPNEPRVVIRCRAFRVNFGDAVLQ